MSLNWPYLWEKLPQKSMERVNNVDSIASLRFLTIPSLPNTLNTGVPECTHPLICLSKQSIPQMSMRPGWCPQMSQMSKLVSPDVPNVHVGVPKCPRRSVLAAATPRCSYMISCQTIPTGFSSPHHSEQPAKHKILGK